MPEGSRVTGLRTFTLAGLLGGILGHLQQNFGPWPLVAAILGLSLFLTVSLRPAAKQWLGTSGIYVLFTLSGLADVDAILISLARMYGSGGLVTEVAVISLGLTTLTNMVSKATIAWTTGGAQFGKFIIIGYTIAMLFAGLTPSITLRFS